MHRRLLVAMAVLTLVWGCADASLGLSAGVVHLAPFLLLLFPLLAGRYIGEERLARLTGAVGRPRRHLARGPAPASQRAVCMPRGRELLARSLAVRPPPASLAKS